MVHAFRIWKVCFHIRIKQYRVLFGDKVPYGHRAILIQNAHRISLLHGFGIFSTHTFFAFQIVLRQHIVGWDLFVFFFISFSFSLSCFSATDNAYYDGFTFFFTFRMYSK